MQKLKGKKILLGLSGGVALYKMADLVSKLNKAGADCRVIMTDHAEKFVGKSTFQALTKHKVYDDLFAEEEFIPHIELTKWADVFLIAPATANILAKMATGVADDLLSTTALASMCPIMVAPTMNVRMFDHPTTQTNIKLLADRGVEVISPPAGHLACGDVGKGRLPEPEDLIELLEAHFTSKDLVGKRILVTAGPTVEYFDPVRFLSNRSTGKQGFALARQAVRRGAEVCLVHSPVHLKVPQGLACEKTVETSQDLLEALREPFKTCHALIMAAAPSDYRPKEIKDHKIKKEDQDGRTIDLVANPDILKTLTEEKKDQVVIGFAAETRNVEAYAREKLESKRMDYIVANDVSENGAGFAGETNIVHILSETDQKDYPIMTKEEVADLILDLLV